MVILHAFWSSAVFFSNIYFFFRIDLCLLSVSNISDPNQDRHLPGLILVQSICRRLSTDYKSLRAGKALMILSYGSQKHVNRYISSHCGPLTFVADRSTEPSGGVTTTPWQRPVTRVVTFSKTSMSNLK